MDADDLDVVDTRQFFHHGTKAARRKDQRIAAREDDFPYLRMHPDVFEGARHRLRRQCVWLVRSDHSAAEAEATIYGAYVRQLEQDTIRIAMNDPLDRAM